MYKGSVFLRFSGTHASQQDHYRGRQKMRCSGGDLVLFQRGLHSVATGLSWSHRESKEHQWLALTRWWSRGDSNRRPSLALSALEMEPMSGSFRRESAGRSLGDQFSDRL